METGTGILVALILVGGAVGVYFLARSTKPPITAVVQAPSPAVAGINAIGALAAKGIDAWIAAKANKESDDD